MNIEQEVVALLTRRQETVAVAESCTGGMIAARLVDVPGVSGCFHEGYVTYSNEAKEKNLGVKHDTLTTYSAVSEQTAAEMAQGVKARSGATYGIATTGIAGPDGGTPDKPVGLVYIACAYGTQVRTLRQVFSGNRFQVRTQATEKAFALLQSVMKECEDVLCES